MVSSSARVYRCSCTTDEWLVLQRFALPVGPVIAAPALGGAATPGCSCHGSMAFLAYLLLIAALPLVVGRFWESNRKQAGRRGRGQRARRDLPGVERRGRGASAGVAARVPRVHGPA